MRRLLLRRLVVIGIGLGALLTAAVSTVSVSAAPPQVFTNNGCVVGNYTCLQNAVTACPNGNYSCLQNVFGNLYFGRPYLYSYAPYYPTVAYATPYYVTAPAAPAAAMGSVVSGRLASVGQATSFSLSGFTAGESVMASITGPSGQVTQIGAAAASGDGVVTITVTFPSTGTWQVTAHGQTSNKNIVSQYTVQ